ncbi:NAD-dependent epimerase/dehydratase family protein [Chromobacterium vaccinii]|nr:NAD-dependent epimerase/dehydratase family protein [Chromobacterium vaccinii]
MKILLLGCNGFIGRSLATRLIEAGHELLAPSRAELDLARPDQDWAAWLDRTEALANLAGVFRQGRSGGLEAVHHHGPLCLAGVAKKYGVRRWVQLSALGAAPDAATLFLASKGRGDAALLGGGLDVAVARPSLVYGIDGASSRLLMRLARLPLWFLPDGGRQPIQPVAAVDVVDGLHRLIEGRVRGAVDFVGAEEATLADYLRRLRSLQGLGPIERVQALPGWLADGLASCCGRIPGSLLDRDSLRMLRQGSTADPAAFAALLGRSPLSFRQFGEAI